MSETTSMTLPGRPSESRSPEARPSECRPGMQRVEEHDAWPLLSRIPLRLTAGVPVSGFKVRDLLALGPGVVVPTAWPCTEDVPLRMGQVQLSWSEFEVVEGRLAVRLTRLG